MKVLFMFAAALALASACDGDEGDTYAEMYTETGECGETHYEDTCGAWVDLNDNDVLEEELGACKVAQTNYEGVSPPNSPEVSLFRQKLEKKANRKNSKKPSRPKTTFFANFRAFRAFSSQF